MWIILGILALPILEIALFVQIGSEIGVLATLGWVLATAVLGALLLRLEPVRSQAELRAALAADQSPASPMAHAAGRALGAGLLFLPGFFTDALGLLLLIPPLRHWVLAKLLLRLKANVHHRETVIIEGEFEQAPPPPTGQLPPDRPKNWD